ncbi:HRAS-like suppressor 3 isoform X1 [Pomacea canaliculata]|uniref:HRAS-like suppressor 3 isoform X1 n=1 Tax=Pomacea canaliculata TaxID=400727 RepID=UPI000D73322C|nr:HRAS-like suppressor 3 isoform X1 [Pomacea canaliculata]
MSKSASGNSTKEIEEHNRMIMSKAREGDLIEFPRPIYSHWAVYIGNGKVIELTTIVHPGSSTGTPEGIVQEADFMKVAGSSKAKINNEKDKDWEPRLPWQIVATARDLIGSRLYHFLNSNCEHFAKFCRYGKTDSDQAKQFLKKLESLGSNVTAILGLLASFVVMRTKSGAQYQ